MNHLFIPKPSRSAAPPDASLSHALAHSPPPPAPPPKADSNAPGPRPPVRVPITTSDPFVEFIAKDWDEGDEFAMHLQRKADDKLARKNKKRADKGQPSLAPDDVPAIDRLWDDKWDSDDVSDEFSQRLRRTVLEMRSKQIAAAAEAQAAVDEEEEVAVVAVE